jgi:hypothetical protein
MAASPEDLHFQRKSPNIYCNKKYAGKDFEGGSRGLI